MSSSRCCSVCWAWRRWTTPAPGRTGGALLAGLLGLAGACLAAGIGFTDYGMAGVLTVVLFGVCRGFPGAWAAQLVGMVLLHGVLLAGEFIPLKLPFGVWELPVQGLAVLALLPIWLYNGKKGRGGRGGSTPAICSIRCTCCCSTLLRCGGRQNRLVSRLFFCYAVDSGRRSRRPASLPRQMPAEHRVLFLGGNYEYFGYRLR